MKPKAQKRVEAIQRSADSIVRISARLLAGVKPELDAKLRVRVKRAEEAVSNTEKRLDAESPGWRQRYARI